MTYLEELDQEAQQEILSIGAQLLNQCHGEWSNDDEAVARIVLKLGLPLDPRPLPGETSGSHIMYFQDGMNMYCFGHWYGHEDATDNGWRMFRMNGKKLLKYTGSDMKKLAAVMIAVTYLMGFDGAKFKDSKFLSNITN